MPPRVLWLGITLCMAGCRLSPTDESMTLATGQPSSTALRLDDTSVYWLNPNSGTVMKVAKSGGEPVTLASGQSDLQALTLDANTVYWTTDELVLSVPKAGGAPQVLASGEAVPSALTTDGVKLYWANSAEGTTRAMPVGGGGVTTLAMWTGGPALSIVADAANVYWTTEGTPDKGFSDGQVLKVPRAGGDVTVLVSNSMSPLGLALHKGSLVWLQNNAVMSVPTFGGSPTFLAFASQTPLALAIDEGFLYWSTLSPSTGSGMVPTGDIESTALPGGGGTRSIVAGLATPSSIAVDATSLYWTDAAAGTVGKYTFR